MVRLRPLTRAEGPSIAGGTAPAGRTRVDRVVAVTGTVVPFTAEDLEAAGAGIGIDDESLADFQGDAVLVATAVEDPLAP